MGEKVFWRRRRYEKEEKRQQGHGGAWITQSKIIKSFRGFD